MRLGRAAGVALLSLVDAFVPSTAVGLAVFLAATDPLVPVDGPLRLAGGAAAIVFVGTILLGAVAVALGSRPFPFTRAVKWLWRRWPL